MPKTSQRRKSQPPQESPEEFSPLGVVERAISGMTKRLEKGEKPFTEYECRLFVALIQVQNNKNLMSDHELLEEWGDRFDGIENWIRARQSEQAIQSATRTQRRPPGIQRQGIQGLDGNTTR